MQEFFLRPQKSGRCTVSCERISNLRHALLSDVFDSDEKLIRSIRILNDANFGNSQSKSEIAQN